MRQHSLKMAGTGRRDRGFVSSCLTGAAAGVSAALVLSTAVFAAGGAGADAQARYRSERAACINGSSNQDRATCLTEAGAALQEARRGGLENATGARLDNNRSERCSALPAAEREKCLKRMRGEGITEGSARDGGIYREITTTTVTPARQEHPVR